MQSPRIRFILSTAPATNPLSSISSFSSRPSRLKKIYKENCREMFILQLKEVINKKSWSNGRGSFLSTKMLLLVYFLIVYWAANPCFGRTLAYFLLTFLFVDKRNGRDYIYLNTKEVSLSFYSNSFTMNLRQRKQFLPLPVLQVISKHSSYGFFC